MTSVTIQMPDSLVPWIDECAKREGITRDQLLCSAAAEKLSALISADDLRVRMQSADRSEFEAFLNASPDVDPVPGDS